MLLFSVKLIALLMCGIPVVFLKHVINEYNPSMHSFNVAIVECCYMFRLLQSNHSQALYQKYKKEIILQEITLQN
jgi:hypothetical protein